MVISIKVIPSKKNEWLGWFGNNLIKLRLIRNSNSLRQDFLNFLISNLGIKENYIKILKEDKNVFEIEIPDIGWELFLSVVK